MRLCTRVFWQREAEQRAAKKKPQQDDEQQEQQQLYEDFEALVSHRDAIRANDKVRAAGTQRVSALVAERYACGTRGQARAVTAGEAETALYRMQCNDFGVWDGLVVCVGAGVFPAGAMVNHACDANCVVTYSFAPGRRPVQQFRAVRALRPHEEITHCYLDLASTAASRRADLRGQYLFACRCPRCVPEPTEHDAQLVGVLPDATPELLQLAEQLHERGRDLREPPERCVTWLRQCYDIRRRCLHERNLVLMTTAAHLMTAALEAGDWHLARRCGEHVLATYRAVYPPVHPMLGLHLYTLGDIAAHTGDAAAALAHHREALAILALTHGRDTPLVIGLQRLVDTEQQQQKHP